MQYHHHCLNNVALVSPLSRGHHPLPVPSSISTPHCRVKVHGGSPYGAGTIAGGDGSRMPTDLEKGASIKSTPVCTHGRML